MKVGVFVGTRADLAPLEPVIAACAAQRDFTTHVLCAVDWTADELASKLRTEIAFQGTVTPLAEPMDAVTPDTMLAQGAAITEGMRSMSPTVTLDALVVLGDRWELIYVVWSAVLLGVRVVHIHGGEITEGAIDERVRHAVTKMADFHCAASLDAAERIAGLGEPWDRIMITGAPGLDRLSRRPLSDAEIGEMIGTEVVRPLALFTYHPPTAAEGAPIRQWATQALVATSSLCPTVIATEPGMDEGRDDILNGIRQVAAENQGVVVVRSLGPQYPATLCAVDVVVGNSSSGVIEAAAVGVPAVDVGDRQRGRLRASSVLHADDSSESVRQAVATALRPETRALAQTEGSPYGDGSAAPKIVEAVRLVMRQPRSKNFAPSKAP